MRQPVLSHDARPRARALSFCNPVSANHARSGVYKQSGQNEHNWEISIYFK